MKSSDKKTAKLKPTVVEVQEPATHNGNLKPIGGSMSDDWNKVLATQTIQTLG